MITQIFGKPRSWFICLLLLVLVTAAAVAQTIVTGELTGTVTDPSNAAVANAKVTLKSDATGELQTSATTVTGQFRFTMLRPGTYSLTISATGFQERTHKSTVNLGQVSTLQIQLGIQGQTQVVNVTEEAALVQSENANLATTFDSRQLQNLPAPGNDMTSYAFTAPGVTVSTGGGYGAFSAFGMSATSNLFTVNGTDNMDPYLNLNNSGASNLTLGANEIQEAAVVMNGYTGQYGRQAGAQVNYVTRSGSNGFHGNAAWFFNGNKLNANDFFNNATDTPRPHAVSNEWAASGGGRIIRDKLFFYADTEGLRYVLPGGGPVYIPTSAFSSYVLNGLKTTAPTAIPFYTTALNLYAGSSGASRATPVTRGLDDAMGCGDFTGGGFGTTQPCASTYRSTVNNLNTEWLLASRVDYNLTNTDRLYVRYNMDRGVQATGTDPIHPSFNANSVQPSYGGQFGYTKTINSTIVNQLLASASYYSALFGPPDIATALKTFPTTWAFADGLYSNLGGTDNNYPQGRKVRQFQLIDDLSITHATHALKFGFNMRQNFVSSYVSGVNTSGLMTFNSMSDFVAGSFGNGSTYSQAFANVGAQPLRMYSFGFYAQDEWKVKPNLTLTLALRLDRNSNIKCDSNCFNEFGVPFAGLPHNAATPYNAAIQTGVSNVFPHNQAVVAAPRIGFAYTAAKSTVIRGGFGVFSDLYQGTIADRFITNLPGVASFTTTAGTVALNDPKSVFAAVANSNSAMLSGFKTGATLAQLQASVPLGFATPNFNTIADKVLNPKFYEWNLEVQQALGSRYVLSLNYVGNKGVDEINQTYLGNAYTKPGFSLPGLPATRPDARFGQIREMNNDGWSNYNGLVTSFKWRLAENFSGTLSYTWSHSFDTCSNGCLTPFNNLTAPSIRYQISPLGLGALNYSSSDYDVRHTVSANYNYTVPKKYFKSAALRNTLAGWTLAGTLTFHGGYPFSVVTTGVRSSQLNGASGVGTFNPLADWLGQGFPSCTQPDVPCYSKSLFATATTQHDLGNVPRNSFRGPGYFNTDLNIKKTIDLGEKYRLEVGAFLFNLFNHPNFDLPTNSLTSGAFGYIESTVSAPTSAYGSFQGSAVSGRVVQTQIKFVF